MYKYNYKTITKSIDDINEIINYTNKQKSMGVISQNFSKHSYGNAMRYLKNILENIYNNCECINEYLKDFKIDIEILEKTLIKNGFAGSPTTSSSVAISQYRSQIDEALSYSFKEYIYPDDKLFKLTPITSAINKALALAKECNSSLAAVVTSALAYLMGNYDDKEITITESEGSVEVTTIARTVINEEVMEEKPFVPEKETPKKSEHIEETTQPLVEDKEPVKTTIPDKEEVTKQAKEEQLTTKTEKETKQADPKPTKPEKESKKEKAKGNTIYNETPPSSPGIYVSGLSASDGYGPEFLEKVKEIAKKHNLDYTELLAMMYQESGLRARSEENGYYGFLRMNSEGLAIQGYTGADILNMTPIEQLDVVDGRLYVLEPYLKNTPNPTVKDYYSANFLPARANNEVLCSTEILSWAYKSNKGVDLNKDGKITKTEMQQWLNKKKVDDSSFSAD